MSPARPRWPYRSRHWKQAVHADPASITAIELALDTALAATIAPVWAALLTGSTGART
jgi:4a-hydroxytetrahydrobiopterin dehydratase